MPTVQTSSMTADEFFDWIHRPENHDRLWELERGEALEMPSPSELHGVVCFLIVRLLGNYVFQRGRGYVCSNDTGLLVEQGPDTVRGPDVILYDESRRWDELSRKFAVTIPRLVVEVLSPSDKLGKVLRRISQYLKRGVPLVWLVDPEARIVTVYRPGKEQRVLEETEELSGEEILSDWHCQVAEFFALPGESSRV